MGGDKVEGAAIGIDLGNCYTAVGVFRNDRFEIIPNEQGNSTTPSFVSFTDTGRLLGDAAKSRAAANPTNTITNAKSFLGLQADMPQHRDVPFKVVQRLMIEVEHRGEMKRYAPEEIVAMVLGIVILVPLRDF